MQNIHWHKDKTRLSPYYDHRRGRTCNLLIRSQTRCHFARRPRKVLPITQYDEKCDLSLGVASSGCAKSRFSFSSAKSTGGIAFLCPSSALYSLQLVMFARDPATSAAINALTRTAAAKTKSHLMRSVAFPCLTLFPMSHL